MNKDKSILYIAFHFPPILGSSGVHRTLAFTRHLSKQGWSVDVLTASVKAYDHWSKEQIAFIPSRVNVIRAFGRNTAKQFSLKGKYLSWMALPDNWQSWIIGGAISGYKAINKKKPKIIVSTYPIASAHIIAYILHKITGIPWVADLRDPMAQEGYPSNPTKKKIFEWIEKKIIQHCSYAMVTTQGAKKLYEERYPETPKAFWCNIPNGYDAELFDEVGLFESKVKQSPIVLLHSGIVYPSERDPLPFFNAVSELKKQGGIDCNKLIIRLRATGHDHLYQPILKELQIEDIVILEPAIPFKEALKEMMTVDSLLLLQASGCDYQIPAKAYEYIKASKPILALTTENGDTGRLMSNIPKATIAPLNDELKIMKGLTFFLNAVKTNQFESLNEKDIYQYSRQYHALKFEELLSKVIEA